MLCCTCTWSHLRPHINWSRSVMSWVLLPSPPPPVCPAPTPFPPANTANSLPLMLICPAVLRPCKACSCNSHTVQHGVGTASHDQSKEKRQKTELISGPVVVMGRCRSPASAFTDSTKPLVHGGYLPLILKSFYQPYTYTRAQVTCSKRDSSTEDVRQSETERSQSQ